MAYRQDGPFRSYPAGADLSALQYRAVLIDTAGKLQQNTVIGGRIVGILQDDPKNGSNGTVQVRDVSKAVAGATFAIGALLMSDAVGRLITATATNYVVARAYQAGVVGRIVAVELFAGQALL